MQEQVPELYSHFQALGIATSMFASSWFLALYTTILPLPLACRVFDAFLSEVVVLRLCRHLWNGFIWKKRSDTNTACSKVEPKIFAPPQTPFPGSQDDQNLISCRWSLPSPTNTVWWRSMHAISSYRGNRPTNTHKQTNPQTGPITIQCAAELSTQCNYHTSAYLLLWRCWLGFRDSICVWQIMLFDWMFINTQWNC